AEEDALREQEVERRQGGADQIGRRDVGLADEAADRIHLVLDHGGDFGLLHLAEIVDREAQHPVEELIAQAPQHALAAPALIDQPPLLHPAIGDNEEQEAEAERKQVILLVERDALEQGELRNAKPVIGAEGQMQERQLVDVGLLEGIAAYAVIDNLFRE